MMLPFCVKGNLEPARMLCVVGYWHCHIIVENTDSKIRLKKENIMHEYSYTSMIVFCQQACLL